MSRILLFFKFRLPNHVKQFAGYRFSEIKSMSFQPNEAEGFFKVAKWISAF